jgi:hypothetical protein
MLWLIPQHLFELTLGVFKSSCLKRRNGCSEIFVG